ncbi:MAG TPA: tyrosine-type recombinase/integrase [Mycobacterium sp.]
MRGGVGTVLPGRTGRRDQALLALAVQTGLRISELITLTRNDIHTATGAHITCLGKGRRHRATPLTRHHAHRHGALPDRTG